ncbi:Zinc finger C2H2-type, partial [Trinorchestia longiramus]
ADMSEVLREFQCKMCFKILGSRAALQRHLKEVHHKVSGGKEDLSTGATCDRCGKMFQNKSNLKIHMLTHSGVKPFKCIESGCNAAFTTKQCLQFHYKKVHGYTGDGMPKIERCIPYTFDSYSGGLVPDPGRGKIPPMPTSMEQTSVVSNPTSPSQSLELSHTNTPLQQEEPPISPMTSDSESQSRPAEVLLDVAKLPPAATLHGYVAKYAAAATRLVSKGSRKWLGDSLELYDRDQQDTSSSGGGRDIYDFEERMDADSHRRREKEELVGVDDERLLRRESNASLLVEAALSVAELRGYSSGRCSPSLQTSQNDQLQLPHEA